MKVCRDGSIMTKTGKCVDIFEKIEKRGIPYKVKEYPKESSNDLDDLIKTMKSVQLKESSTNLDDLIKTMKTVQLKESSTKKDETVQLNEDSDLIRELNAIISGKKMNNERTKKMLETKSIKVEKKKQAVEKGKKTKEMNKVMKMLSGL